MSDPLALIRDLRELLTEAPLASSDDADYFRALYKKKAPQQPTIHIPAPLPVPPPRSTPLTVQIGARQPLPPAPTPPVVIPAPTPTRKPQPDSLFSLFEKIAPGFPLLREIPSDERAQKIANRWKTKNQSAPISILSFAEPAQHKILLEQIARAIDVYYGPARLISAEGIEKEKQWDAFLSVDNLKLILCCDYTLWQLNHLMKYFKEVPANKTRHLGKVPLFLLPDLSLYLKDPLLKRSLWKALCQTISSL